MGWAPETRVPGQGTYEEVVAGEAGKEGIKQDRKAGSQASQIPDPVGSSGD